MKDLPLAVLVLVSGYSFATTWLVSLVHSARESGDRLYFRTVFYSAFLLILSLLIHIIFYTKTLFYPEFINSFDTIIKYKDASIFGKTSVLAIVLYSFPLGISLGHFLNFPKRDWFINMTIGKYNYKPFYKFDQYVIRNAIKNNDFEKLVFKAFLKKMPLLVTLDGGKVYSGLVLSCPNPTTERRSLKILPLLSGFRDQETHEVHFTVNYYDVFDEIIDDEKYEHLDIDDFDVILPTSQISSAHLFDIDVYVNCFSAQKEEIEEESRAE